MKTRQNRYHSLEGKVKLVPVDSVTDIWPFIGELFNYYKNRKKIYITREIPGPKLKHYFNNSDVELYWLTNIKSNFNNILSPNYENILSLLKESIENPSIIILDGIEYLATQNKNFDTFNQTQKTITEFNDDISKTNSITIVPINKKVINGQQYSLLCRTIGKEIYPENLK